VVGEVVAVGESVDSLRPGDRVGLGWIANSCRRCLACLRGEENVCVKGYKGLIVAGSHGGFQEICRASADFVYGIPEGLDSASAAPLLCAGVTVYAPLRRHIDRPGASVGVLGVGGLGHLALQFASKMGAEVTALDISPDKAAESQQLGAHAFHTWGSAIGEVGLQGHFDVLLNCASANISTTQLMSLLKNGGTLVQVGIPGGGASMAVQVQDLVFGQKKIAGTIVGGRADMQEMLEFAAVHGVRPMVEEMPLSQEHPDADKEVTDAQFKFRGREWHPESFGYTNCSAPTPLIDPTRNIFDCRILRDVCVDQGVIIYQDSRFHPWTSEHRLPYFNITDILWNTPSVLGIGDKWRNGKNKYQFPLMRPWHHMEESEDVRRPVFSNCTTPLLFFHHFPFNVAEVYRFAVNNIYFLQRRLQFFDERPHSTSTPRETLRPRPRLRNSLSRITLVPGNPPMSAVPSFTRFWLQPFSRYAVTSLGHLSQRWPPGSPPPPSAATGEGVAVRCFSRFLMCKITLKKPTGAFFEAGQFVARYYAEKAIPMEANFTQRLAAEVPLDEQKDDTVLKVVFAESEGASSIFRRVRCFRHIFGIDNLYDLWVVRRSDVLVGVHGSALTNALFMRPGSSLIELRPYGFSGRESWPNIYMKSQTRGMEVFWFGIDVMSANLSTPGDFEADMQPMYTRAKGCLARDRNLIVPWEAMAHQLLNVAVVSRNVWRYKVLRYSHSYYVTHDIQPLELPGKDKRAPPELQSWFTDPDEERRRAAAIPLTPEGARAAEEAEAALLAKAAEAAAAAAAELASGGGGGGVGGGGGGEVDANVGDSGSDEGHQQQHQEGQQQKEHQEGQQHQEHQEGQQQKEQQQHQEGHPHVLDLGQGQEADVPLEMSCCCFML
ncbi:hypothetical protein VOLCADRAFT_118856, partial [Volvox carteri f. nagariensis]